LEAHPPLPGMRIGPVPDVQFMARLQSRPADVMRTRFDEGHRAYVAFLNNVPAAFGWVATRTAEIGELGARFAIAPTDRYLWNFVTLEPFRGLGIYPRLLQHIMTMESDAVRFWIAYAPENHASGSGIRKAGFTTAAELSFDEWGAPAVRSLVQGGGELASRVLGIPEVASELTKCWRCIRNGMVDSTCADGQCVCDYQAPEIAC
jgi:GNAT superfamily N-acetyltransferase